MVSEGILVIWKIIVFIYLFNWNHNGEEETGSDGMFGFEKQGQKHKVEKVGSN